MTVTSRLLLAALWLLATQSDPAFGQDDAAGRSFRMDWGVGALVSIPDELESEPCGNYWGLQGSVGGGWALSAGVTLESSLGVALPRPTPCVVEALPLPRDGTATQRVYQDGVDRAVFLSTTHRIAVDLWPSRRLGPALLLGGGRMWTHGMSFWSAGFRLGLGAPPRGWGLEVERMQAGMTYVEETFVLRDGAIVSRSSSDERTHRAPLWSVRVRMPIR